MNCNYCTLEQEALLHISGPDTLTFLQGQTTCDTRNIDSGHALPGVYCTPQGRVVCDFMLCELGPEHYGLRMRRGIRAPSAAAFGKYIIFSKANLEDTREDWQVFGVWGAQAAASLAGVFGQAPSQRFSVCGGEGFAVIQLDDAGEQFECYLDTQSNPGLAAQLADVCGEAAQSDWQALQIAAGIARIEEACVEEFVPQTLNYDLTGHISFTKGCYTGQEVVARLHYRGTPKRRCYIGQVAAGTDCAAGAAVFSANANQSVGNIVNAAACSDNTCVLVCATAQGAEDGLHLGDAQGPAITLLELPYSLEAS